MLMASQLGQRGGFLAQRHAVRMTTLDAPAAGAAR
jgi:hypothetical protein